MQSIRCQMKICIRLIHKRIWISYDIAVGGFGSCRGTRSFDERIGIELTSPSNELSTFDAQIIKIPTSNRRWVGEHTTRGLGLRYRKWVRAICVKFLWSKRRAGLGLAPDNKNGKKTEKFKHHFWEFNLLSFWLHHGRSKTSRRKS